LCEGFNSPQAFSNRSDIEVDFDLVVLEGNERESESRVSAKPELKRNVKGCFRKSVSWGTNLSRGK
jgi:hypothetical protein